MLTHCTHGQGYPCEGDSLSACNTRVHDVPVGLNRNYMHGLMTLYSVHKSVQVQEPDRVFLQLLVSSSSNVIVLTRVTPGRVYRRRQWNAECRIHIISISSLCEILHRHFILEVINSKTFGCSILNIE